MRIENTSIDTGARTFVIAEIGVNHDGSLRRALELVDLAAAGGADAVKLQLFRADQLMNGAAAFAGYQKERVDAASPADMLRQYELSADDTQRVVDAIRARGLVPIATPFSLADIATVEALDLPAVKIASPDVVNRPLLMRAAKTRRPLLVSTGAATIDEVNTAVEWLNDAGAAFALLHCVSSYPVPIESANLCWIGELAKFGTPVGYSDHTTEPLAGALAVASGASIIEKHLTYDRGASGPDHAASADPIAFASYVRMIRQAEALRGVAGKHVLDIECDVRHVSRQSLVAARPLAVGQRVSEADLIVQRPGSGIPAADLTNAIGKRLRRDVSAGTMLSWDMLAEAA